MILLTALLLTACETDEEEAATSPCEEETRSTDVTPGVTFQGDSAMLEFITLEPAAPVAGNENVWTVSLSADGQPLEGCSLSGEIDMPDHGHGGPDPVFTEDGGGDYQMATTLTMGGYWEIDVDIDCPDLSAADAIMLPVCAE